MGVFITGVGVVSCLGIGVKENLDALVNMRSGISEKEVAELNRNYFLGSIPYTNARLEEIGKVVKAGISRTSLLGLIAVQECWGKNQFDNAIKTGFISGTSVGGMDLSENYYSAHYKGNTPNLDFLKYHDSGNTTERIADEIGFSGYINTISTACSSGANAIMLGARMIESGKLDRVLVGGVDAISHFTISGFNSLMIYDDEWCKPFDERRKGLNLGEGAGYLLLESAESISKTKNTVLAELVGWSNTSDAYHQTASSPDGVGAAMAMQQALEKAGLLSSAVDYVSAHGTGTQNNDQSESIALKTVFGDEVPPFSSTKSYTGHTLAASGGIESVFSVLALQHQYIYSNPNYAQSIVDTGLVPVTETVKSKVDVVLSNAFGFGGNGTSLIFKKK